MVRYQRTENNEKPKPEAALVMNSLPQLEPCETFSVTVLESAEAGQFLRKKVRRDADGSVKDAGNSYFPKYFNVRQFQTPYTIAGVFDAISELTLNPQAAITHGCIADTNRVDCVQRRGIENHGDEGTLRDGPTPFLAVDIDSYTPEDGGTFDPADIDHVVSDIAEHLGDNFAGVSCVYQFTSKAAPGARVVKLRLFFLIDQAITNAQRKAWAEFVNATLGQKLVDPAIYASTSLIYTAAPEFVGGADPFPNGRVGIYYGETDEVSWQDRELPKHASGRTYTGKTSRSIEELLSRIGDHPGGDGCHNPITRAIFRMVKERWTRDRIKQTIRDRVQKADWSNHPDKGYIESKISDAALNASIQGAECKNKRDEKPQRDRQTVFSGEAMTLQHAQSEVKKEIRRWLENGGILVLKTTTGVGKTHEAVAALAEQLKAFPGRKAMLFAPNHNQGDEVRIKADELVYGKTQHTPESPLDFVGAVKIEGIGRLCQRKELYQAISKKGLTRHFQSIACGNPYSHKKCPHYHSCEYHRQFDRPTIVRFVPHKYMEYPGSRVFSEDYTAQCEYYVVDESFISTLKKKGNHNLEDIEAETVLKTVLNALACGLPFNESEYLEKITAERDELDESIATLIRPHESDQLIIGEISRLNVKPSHSDLYTAVIRRLEGNKNVVWISQDGRVVYYSFMLPIPEPMKNILILDATADEIIYRGLTGNDIRFIEIHAKRKLEVIQCVDKPIGKDAALGEAFLYQTAALCRMHNAALITYKASIERMNELGLLDGIPHAHFGSLRGLNAFETCTALVVAGRPEPEAFETEETARAIWPKDDLNLTGQYEYRQDGEVSVASHPDANCDAVLRMIRESEIEQAIGRLRDVRDKRVNRVFLLTNTPVAFPGIEITRKPLADILLPEALAKAFIRGGGVLVMSGKWLHRMFPDLWKSEKAAAKFVENNKVPITEALVGYVKRISPLSLLRDLYKQIGSTPYINRKQSGENLSAPDGTPHKPQTITLSPEETLDFLDHGHFVAAAMERGVGPEGATFSPDDIMSAVAKTKEVRREADIQARAPLTAKPLRPEGGTKPSTVLVPKNAAEGIAAKLRELTGETWVDTASRKPKTQNAA